MSELDLLLPPLAAGLLALLSHVPLGRQVLRRGIVFIDLAIAQVAGLGVLIGQHALHHRPGGAPGWTLPMMAGGAALLGAALVAWLSRLWPERQEALIGLLYVGAASYAVLQVSTDPHGAHKLASLLSGDVLWTTWPALWPLALATLLFGLALALRPALLDSGYAFYLSFALLISLSLPLLGLYLVFATLIVPALVAQRSRRRPVPTALAVGAASYGFGLLLSWHRDWPSGPSVVLALILCGAVAMVVADVLTEPPSDNGP